MNCSPPNFWAARLARWWSTIPRQTVATWSCLADPKVTGRWKSGLLVLVGLLVFSKPLWKFPQDYFYPRWLKTIACLGSQALLPSKMHGCVLLLIVGRSLFSGHLWPLCGAILSGVYAGCNFSRRCLGEIISRSIHCRLADHVSFPGLPLPRHRRLARRETARDCHKGLHDRFLWRLDGGCWIFHFGSLDIDKWDQILD